MVNVYFNYQKTVACCQARFGLGYPVLSFQEWLASTNAANVVTTNDNEKQTANQTEKDSTTSESSDDVKTTIKVELSRTMDKHLRWFIFGKTI